MAKIYVIHGYGAWPTKHWFPWLEQLFRAAGASFNVLPMPDADAPDRERWVSTLRDEIGTPDEDSYIVGHSLGGITALRYLEEQPRSARIGGLILVSGFYEPLPEMPELDPFTDGALDFDKLQAVTPHRVVIGAADDTIVSPGHTQRLAQRLDAHFIQLPEGGHFLQDDGYTSLPIVRDELARITGLTVM